MSLVRILYFCAPQYNIHVLTTHIAGLITALLMLSLTFRFTFSTKSLKEQFPTPIPSVHGQPNSWGTAQPLSILRGCSIHKKNIPSRREGSSAILQPIHSTSLSSLTTHLELLLLPHGMPQVSYKTIKVYLAVICLSHIVYLYIILLLFTSTLKFYKFKKGSRDQ